MLNPQKDFERYRRQPRNDMWEYMDFLLGLARESQAILEIGVRGGVSTAAFLCGLRNLGGRLWSIDCNADCARLYAGYPAWTFIAADSRAAHEVIPRITGDLDILFIDGGHDFATAWSDLQNYAPLVRAGGWILMHDAYPIAHRRWEHGVPEAYERFRRETGYPGQILPGRFGLAVIQKVVPA